MNKDTRNCPKPAATAVNSGLLMRVLLISGCQGEGPCLTVLLLDPNTILQRAGMVSMGTPPHPEVEKANGETSLRGSGESERCLYKHPARLGLKFQV